MFQERQVPLQPMRDEQQSILLNLDTDRLPIKPSRNSIELRELMLFLGSETGPFMERTRLRLLENELIMEAKKLSEARGDTELTLSPAREKEIKALSQRLKGKVGGGVALYGPPGTGKSVFARQLGMELMRQDLNRHGYHEATAQSFRPGADMLATRSEHPVRHQSVVMLNLLSQLDSEKSPEEQLQLLKKIVKSVLVSEANNAAQWPIELQNKWYSYYLADVLPLKFLLEVESEAQIGSSAWLDAVITNQNAAEIIQALKMQFKNEIDEIHLYGGENLEYSFLWKAVQLGYVFFLDEADKMHLPIGDLGFGLGLEGLLEAKPNQVVHLDGIPPIKVDNGFLMLIACNDLQKIPAHIRRRFILVEYVPTLSDLVWQARYLLAENDGSSVLEGRPDDEQALVQFLLWFESLARHKEVAFSANALAQLCQNLRSGLEFTKALDEVLATVPAIHNEFFFFQNQGQKVMTAATEGMSVANHLRLAELNWMLNGREAYSRETRKPVERLPQTTALEARLSWQVVNTSTAPGLTLSLSLGENAVTGDVDSVPLAHHALQLENDNLSGNIRVLAHSPAGGCVFIADNSGKFLALDGATGRQLPIEHHQLDKLGIRGKETFAYAGRILAAHFFSEQDGVLVAEKSNGIFQLVSFQKSLKAAPNGVVWQPSLLINRVQEFALHREQQQPYGVQITDDVLQVHTKNTCRTFLLHASLVQPWTEIEVPHTAQISPQLLGTQIRNQDGTNAWVSR